VPGKYGQIKAKLARLLTEGNEGNEERAGRWESEKVGGGKELIAVLLSRKVGFRRFFPENGFVENRRTPILNRRK
jgi:hypothetical protein